MKINSRYFNILFDISKSFSSNNIPKLIICFSNLFKKGGSNFNSSIFRWLTIIITLKLGLTSDDIFAYSKAILANFLSPIQVKFWLNKSNKDGYIISKSRKINILSVSIIYFILFKISSLYLPDFISFLYLLPTSSI